MPDQDAEFSLPAGYNQLCPITFALEELGDRWTLVILRDLARTSLRFTDLQEINPTISPTMLSRRLKRLEVAGIVKKQALRNSAKSSTYSLTDDARPALLPVLTALANFGAFLLEQNPPTADPTEALATQMQLNSHFVMARGSDLHGYFVLDLSGWVTHIVIDDSGFEATSEPPADRLPDARAMFFPPTTLMRIMGRAETLTNAEDQGLVTIEGKREAMVELVDLLSFSND